MKQRLNKITDEEIIKAYKDLKNLCKIAAKFKIPTIQIFRKCKMLGLEFKTGGTRVEIPLIEILEGDHPHFNRCHLKKKLLDAKIFSYRCAICGISKWKNKKLVLILDHINGDSFDHRKENLRLLCPNCNSQTSTFCGRNTVL